MFFPLINVRDKDTGEVHIVGSDRHDLLLVRDGAIEYYNLQNGDGTGERGSYEFLGSQDEMFELIIEFVPIEYLQEVKRKQTEVDNEKFMKMLELRKRFKSEWEDEP